MGDYYITKVDRTVLKLKGKFPERKARQIFERVAGDRMVSMKCFYDKEEDETTILLYPCRAYNMSGECDGKNANEKRIRVLGALPYYVDIVKTYWNPIRARAKAAKDPMRWVTMYPVRSIDDATKAVYTELCFIVDSRCKSGYEDEALNKAVGQIRESLRLIASDIRGDLMASARLTEDVSMDFVDELHKLEDDEVQKKYGERGLRHVNADELVTQE
ncbi:MAG: hypothetical protein MJ155_02870 [Candidatus Saccharibacteria bacterium]|nr:hypothetical protein [Candidatus Saccharibacteria bacterium]